VPSGAVHLAARERGDRLWGCLKPGGKVMSDPRAARVIARRGVGRPCDCGLLNVPSPFGDELPPSSAFVGRRRTAWQSAVASVAQAG